MGQKCSVCQHDNRAEIDKAVAEGKALAQIASQHGVGADALGRHRKHIPASLVVAQKAAEVTQADNLLAEVEAIKSEAKRLGKLAEESGDIKTALTALREWTRVEELMAKLRGEIDESPRVAVLVTHNPEWVALRSTILRALDPFPEALRAVVEALRTQEARQP